MAGSGTCPYPEQPTRNDARVGRAPGPPRDRWRAECACGWAAGGYFTKELAARALQHHRTTARQLRKLSR